MFGLGVFAVVAGWYGQLDRPRRGRPAAATERRPPARPHGRWPIVAAALVYWWTSGWVVAALAAAILGWLAPSLLGLRASRRRQLARSEAIAVWAEMLRDLLVSNAGLHEAIGKSARVAPPVIRDEVRALYVRAQRGDLSAALSRFADEMDDAIADTVVTALHIADQRAVSDLGAMLAAVATSTRETVAMQLRINAARARTYRTAQLIAIIVAFFVGILVLTNREYMEPFGTVVGQVVLAVRRRPRRRVDLGDGRAVAPGPRSSPRSGVGATTVASVIWAALLAAMLGAGVWLVARALVPPPRPLHMLSAELAAPRCRARRRRDRWSHRLAARLTGGTSERLAADLAVLGRTPTRHTLDKLGYAVAVRRARPRAGDPVLAARCRPCPAADGRGRAAVRRRRLVLPGPRGALARRRRRGGHGRRR